MENDLTSTRLPRRTVLKWFAVASVSGELATLPAGAQNAQIPNSVGYGYDPNLAEIYEPGSFWPLTLADAEKNTAISLMDVILPADEFGPAASELRVQDYLDEWVSAPYPRQVSERGIVLPGLKWLDEESTRRFQSGFADLSSEQQTAICDDLCAEKPATPELAKGARFFQVFSNICMGAYFGSPEGWKAIGYVGNIPSPTFAGPPREVLDRLGLEQTVKD